MAIERNTRIRASQISSILPNDLEATNSFVDNYIPSYDLATGKFTWVSNEGGGGGASNLVDLDDVDFDSGTPADNYIMRYDNASGKWKAEVLNHNDISNIQGGTTNEYYHLTSSEYTELSDWLDNVTLGNDGSLILEETIETTSLILSPKAVNPMGSGQEGIWIDSGDSKLKHFDGVDSKEILNTDHTNTYNHTNLHEQNKDTYLAQGTVDQVTAGDAKDAVDKKHTQNSDTLLDEGQANETSASELRIALDTTIPGKANKVSGGVENNFMSIDNEGHPKDSGQKDSDYADAVHNHDTLYLALDNTTPFTPDADYEPATKKYIDDALVGGGFGDMFKNVYDINDNGIVDYAEALADGVTGNEVNYSDVQDAVDNSHSHSNKALLDTYDQTNADLTDAVSKKHDRQHAIDSTSDHTSAITSNNLIDADANGLPDDSGLAVSDVSDAVTKKHTQNTDTETNSNSFSIGDATLNFHKLLEANVGQSGEQPAIRYNKDTGVWQLSNDGSTWEDIEAGTGSGDMLKSTYDTDENGIVDKSESIDDGIGNSATASEIKGAVDDSHTHANKALLDTYDQTNADLTDVISKKHDRQHALNSTSDHTSSITENYLMDADANGLPADSGLAVSDVSDAVTKKHTQNTDTGTSNDDFAVGDGTETDKIISANIGQSGDQPAFKYDVNLNKWRFSNDGTTFQDFGSGGSLTVKAVDNDPTINNVSEIQIDDSTGLILTDEGSGVVKISLGSHWKDLVVDGQTTLTPSGEETLEFEAGSGIAITTNAGTTPKKITISASGSATSYRTSFTNASLSSGILSVTHNLNQKYVVVSIYNNNDILVIPDIELKTVDTLEVDLSGFGTLTGTYNIVVVS